MRSLKSLSIRGDTIVEVMVVLAVLGLAISVSYATANSSLANTRQAQENSEATGLAQSQIEVLRVLAGLSAPVPADQNIFRPNGFCAYAAGAVYKLADSTNAACTIKGLYKIHVLYCGPGNPDAECAGLAGSLTDTFIARVSWEDVRGDGTDTVRLVYRVHKP